MAPVTYDSPLSVKLSVQDWLGIRTQLAFAAFNNRARGEVATAEVTGELLDKLYDQTQSALDAAADAADAEENADCQCDCCDEKFPRSAMGLTTFCGVDTFLCEECRS